VIVLSLLLQEIHRLKLAALRRWNRQIIDGAVFYQVIRGEPMKEFFPTRRATEYPRNYNPLELGLLRSVKGKDNWLAVVDMDADELTRSMLDAAHILYKADKPDERPVEKVSGKKGVQLYWFVQDEGSKTPYMMRDWIYSKYIRAGIEDTCDIYFGRHEDDKTHPHIDITMFQPMRMWRIFCTRLTGRRPNGRFSVPISYGDDIDTVQAKMKLDLRLQYEADTTRKVLKMKNIDHIFDITSYQDANLPPSAAPPLDAVEERLTPMLRALMHTKGVPQHQWRYALVSYLYCYMGVRDPESIVAFLMERTEWENKSPGQMRYQVRSIVKTCQNKWPEKPVPEFVWRKVDEEAGNV
jgi:hypothetical protein